MWITSVRLWHGVLAFALVTAGFAFSLTVPSDALAAMSPHQAYKACRAELWGIGRGRGAPQRRFNMIEHCVQRKLIAN
jgi:hypothetical protein